MQIQKFIRRGTNLEVPLVFTNIREEVGRRKSSPEVNVEAEELIRSTLEKPHELLAVCKLEPRKAGCVTLVQDQEKTDGPAQAGGPTREQECECAHE